MPYTVSICLSLSGAVSFSKGDSRWHIHLQVFHGGVQDSGTLSARTDVFVSRRCRTLRSLEKWGLSWKNISSRGGPFGFRKRSTARFFPVYDQWLVVRQRCVFLISS